MPVISVIWGEGSCLKTRMTVCWGQLCDAVLKMAATRTSSNRTVGSHQRIHKNHIWSLLQQLDYPHRNQLGIKSQRTLGVNIKNVQAKGIECQRARSSCRESKQNRTVVASNTKFGLCFPTSRCVRSFSSAHTSAVFIFVIIALHRTKTKETLHSRLENGTKRFATIPGQLR